MTDHLKLKCINAHDLCYQGPPCLYCEPVYPPRYENGRFAPYKTKEILEDTANKYEDVLRR